MLAAGAVSHVTDPFLVPETIQKRSREHFEVRGALRQVCGDHGRQDWSEAKAQGGKEHPAVELFSSVLQQDGKPASSSEL